MQSLATKFEAYLLTERRVSANTFAAYKRDVQQFILFCTTAAYDIAHGVSLEQFRIFLAFLKQEGITARSVARKISSLRLFFSYLEEHHTLPNPLRDVVAPTIEKRLPQALSEDDILALLKVADTDTSRMGLRNKIMLYLVYTTGMRVSELTRLTIDDILFDTGFILIRGKGGKERLVPVPTPMLDAVREYLTTVHPNATRHDRAASKTHYLFPVLYGGSVKPITRQSFWLILKELWERTGIQRPLSPHIIRHTLATHMLKNGVDLRSLQLILGHENLATVQMYTHVETTHLRAVYDKKHPRSE